MDRTVIMGFFREEEMLRGEVNWRGKYLNEIKRLNGQEVINPETDADVIAYLIGKENNDENCFRLQLSNVTVSDDQMKVNYSVEGKTEFDSAYLKNAVWSLIPKEKLTSPFLPLCVILEKESFDRSIEDITLISEIKKLQKKNDWQGIYSHFKSMEEVKNNKLIRNNETILNGLSFAAAKLSETYINLRFSFKTDKERNEFMAGQKKYREETVMLRKRLIELNPKNASYYSNLGYSYYQFARELMMPGGRRDGKIMEDAKSAIEYIEKALKLDPQRVTDHYRKGQILTVIMPPQILFGGKNSPGEEAVKESREKIHEGIKAFKNIEEVWEILPLLEDKMIKRYHKEYVKSLYDTARAYGDLAGDCWDITQYLLPLKFDEYSEDTSDNTREDTSKVTDRYIQEKIDHLDNAIHYIEKCAAADNTEYADKFPPPPVVSLCRYNGISDGSHKLYSIGKFYFQKYLLLTQCDERYLPEAEMYRKSAEDFLSAALRFIPKPENTRQNKSYIAEKLARVYISKGEYSRAIEILKRYMNERTGYYIRYTYSTACVLAGKYDEAEIQTKSALKNERSNFEIWLGYFLLYVKNLKENNIKESEKYLKQSMDICNKTGKKSPVSLLIGQAYISQKKGEMKEAVRIMRAAEAISPGRKGIRKKISNWTQEGGF